MRRRDFIAVVGGATAAAWPLTALAQGKLPTVATLVGLSRTKANGSPLLWSASVNLDGWRTAPSLLNVDGRRGRAERVAEIAAELVQQKVDVIVTIGGAVAIVKRATTSIPIVFAIAIDPVGIGLVASLSHPGGNVTGLSLQAAENASKRLELLREIIPGFGRLAILFDTTYAASTREADNVQRSARQFGLVAVPGGVQRAADIPAAFDAFKGQVDAVYVAETALLDSDRAEIISLALAAKLPVTAITGDFAEDGALMSYGAKIFALSSRE